MAAPNVVNVTSIYGKTKTQAATTGAVTLLAGVTNKVLKVNTVIACNTNTLSSIEATLTYNDGSLAVDIAQSIVVPAKASLIIIDKASSLYVEEGHTIQVKGNSTAVEFTISYEEIS